MMFSEHHISWGPLTPESIYYAQANEKVKSSCQKDKERF
jgi:hypothetical protein